MELSIIVKVILTIVIAMAVIVFVAIPDKGKKIRSEQVFCMLTIGGMAMVIIYNMLTQGGT